MDHFSLSLTSPPFRLTEQPGTRTPRSPLLLPPQSHCQPAAPGLPAHCLHREGRAPLQGIAAATHAERLVTRS